MTETKKKPYRRLRGNGQGTAYKRGRTWTAVYIYTWIEGKPQKRTKGGFKTKRAALDYIPVLKAKKTRAGSNITFGKLFEEWVPFYTPRIVESTMKGLKSAFKWFADIANVAVVELTIDDLQDCVDACPRGKRTRENMKYLATQLYKYAEARKILHGNIAEFIYCGKENGGTRPPFTTEQIEMIRKAIGTEFGADYVYCMIYTGFRPNEMLQLTRDSYDAEHDCLVGGFKTEAGRDRSVTISPKIADIVHALIEKADPWIFPNEDGDILTGDAFREDVFYPLLEQLGIQPIPDKDHPATWKPYSCRHTFANLMKNVAGSDTDKAALMGHADASMTKYYQSADYESLKAITDAI